MYTDEDDSEGEKGDGDGLGSDPFQPDPVTLPAEGFMPEQDEDIKRIYQQHWSSIRQHFHRHRPIQDLYNFRLTDLGSMGGYLDAIFQDQSGGFTINYSFGYVLRHKETGQLRYFYASTNNTRVLQQPHRVDSRAALTALQTTVSKTDPLEWAQQQRPTTRWAVELLTNALFFVHRLPNQPIGRGPVKLPPYLRNNRGLYTMVCGAH